MQPLPQPEARLPYDVIVVLGAAVWPQGQASPALQRRVLHAVDLMQRGYATYLLCTGGVGTFPPAEAHVMQNLAHAHGIPPSCIVLEDRSTSTFESALRCSRLLRHQAWSRVMLVTDAYHLPRALLAFRACGVRAVGSAAAGKPARRVWKRWYYYGREGCACVWYLLRLLPIIWQRWRHLETPDVPASR